MRIATSLVGVKLVAVHLELGRPIFLTPSPQKLTSPAGRALVDGHGEVADRRLPVGAGDRHVADAVLGVVVGLARLRRRIAGRKRGQKVVVDAVQRPTGRVVRLALVGRVAPGGLGAAPDRRLILMVDDDRCGRPGSSAAQIVGGLERPGRPVGDAACPCRRRSRCRSRAPSTSTGSGRRAAGG